MKKKPDAFIRAFHEGNNDHAYELLGLHRTENGFLFRVWAPHAKQVFVEGDFNQWTPVDPLFRISGGGIWEAELPSSRVKPGQNYKYVIQTQGEIYYRADPYGSRYECAQRPASVIDTVEGYAWRDGGWMTYRKCFGRELYSQPIHIYRIEAGTFMKRDDGLPCRYRELATELAPYVKQMGYTHVEWTDSPFSDREPCNRTSLFAPDPRYGTPAEFMEFVDSMHEAGVGVILNWNPCCFMEDDHGLTDFDGSPLYEYSDPGRRFFGSANKRRFDLGKGEVISFLVSSLMSWIERYHVDGFSVRSVSSAIYLDYGKSEGEWEANEYGDNRCMEAIQFFRRLNRTVKESYPEIIMIAEEHTAWQGVTNFSGYSGLGFDLKWNQGWTTDVLSYCEMDPIYRKYHHEKMTFSMVQAFSERYLLPLCNEADPRGVQDRMFGDDWQRFATHRALLGWMMTHPGKKLTFMGNEIGQFRSWSLDRAVEWDLLSLVPHARFQHYASELNHLYLQTPALWEKDDSWDGFRWIDPDNREQSILSYTRTDSKGNFVLVVINFTPVIRENFSLGVPRSGIYEEIFNSDEFRFGGSGVANGSEIHSVGRPENYLPHSIRLTIPPLGIVILRKKDR